MKIVKRILKITGSVLLCAISVILGLFTGTQISDKYFTINKYEGITVAELCDDISKIDYEGKTPDQLSPIEAYLISIEKLKSQNYYYKDLFGEMNTNVGIKQYAHSTSEKIGDTYSQAFSTSSSMMKSAGRTTYKAGDDIVLERGEPSGNTLNTVTWSNKMENYTYNEYSDLMGQNPTTESAYIVSSKTATDVGSCVYDNGIYTFKITLDPTLSTICYVYKMGFLSGVDINTINFSSVELEFKLDSDFNILSENYYESYSLKYSGLSVSLTAVYTIRFSY